MKLQFKHPPFQAEAAAAVCDVFNGQPRLTATYRMDVSYEKTAPGHGSGFDCERRDGQAA